MVVSPLYRHQACIEHFCYFSKVLLKVSTVCSKRKTRCLLPLTFPFAASIADSLYICLCKYVFRTTLATVWRSNLLLYDMIFIATLNTILLYCIVYCYGRRKYNLQLPIFFKIYNKNLYVAQVTNIIQNTDTVVRCNYRIVRVIYFTHIQIAKYQ